MIKLTTPSSFFQQVVVLCRTNARFILDRADIPRAYAETPANLTHKLRTRAGLHFTIERVNNIYIFIRNENNSH